MSSWIGDLRYALRQLGRAPGFTAAAVGVLALGIGLNAGMFSLVYAIGFAGRAYADPDRVVQLYSSRTSDPDSYRAFSFPAYQQLASTDGFSGVLAHTPALVGVSEGGESRRTLRRARQPQLLRRARRPGGDRPRLHRGGDPAGPGRAGRGRLLGVLAAAPPRPGPGRVDGAGQRAAVHRRWHHAARLHRARCRCSGPSCSFRSACSTPSPTTSTAPRPGGSSGPTPTTCSWSAAWRQGCRWRRRRPGLSPAAAALTTAMPAEYRDARLTVAPLPRFGTSTSPMDEGAVGLLGAVMIGLTAAVLLTVCLNLAAMLLARGRARRKELAIRLALGSSRARLVRQLLIESVLLALAGGLVGAPLAAWGVTALQNTFAGVLPVTLVLDGTRSPVVVGATLGFCVLATLWFALVPALRHSRADVIDDLKGHAGEDAVRRRRRWLPRHPLVAAQVALSVALLIAAGLFLRMARTAMTADLGYDAATTVLAEVDGGLAGYEPARALDVLNAVERRLAALPGVESVGVAPVVPMGFLHLSRDVRRAGPEPPDGARPATPEAGRAFDSPWNAVSRGYFAGHGRAPPGRPYLQRQRELRRRRAARGDPRRGAGAPVVAGRRRAGRTDPVRVARRRPHRLRRRRHRRGHALGAVRTRAAGRRVRAAGPRRTRADVLPRAAGRAVAGPRRRRPARGPRGRAGFAVVQRSHASTTTWPPRSSSGRSVGPASSSPCSASPRWSWRWSASTV